LFAAQFCIDTAAVDVAVHHAVVTLTGQVERRTLVAPPLDAVRSTAGVVGMHDNLSYRHDDTFVQTIGPFYQPLQGNIMKALSYHGLGGHSWSDVAEPTLRDAEDAIVRVDAVTICGTDLHILKGDVPEVEDGRILGHEAVGTVTEVGASVRTIQPGDRVVVSCISACGRCRYLPRRQLRPVPGRRWLDPRPPDRRHPGRVRPRTVRRTISLQAAGRCHR
jgi:alcohol dehydrogenase-like protein